MNPDIHFQTTIHDVDWAALVDEFKADNFHNNGRTPDKLQHSFDNSAVVALARTADGRITGTARALSDGVCNAYVVDAWTHSDYRRRGIAAHIMRLLEAELPGQHIYLFTDNMIPFYESLGYEKQDTGLGKIAGRWLNRF